MKRNAFFPGHEEVIAESYDSEGKDKRFEENPSGAPGKPPRILAADIKIASKRYHLVALAECYS